MSSHGQAVKSTAAAQSAANVDQNVKLDDLAVRLAQLEAISHKSNDMVSLILQHVQSMSATKMHTTVAEIATDPPGSQHPLSPLDAAANDSLALTQRNRPASTMSQLRHASSTSAANIVINDEAVIQATNAAAEDHWKGGDDSSLYAALICFICVVYRLFVGSGKLILRSIKTIRASEQQALEKRKAPEEQRKLVITAGPTSVSTFVPNSATSKAKITTMQDYMAKVAAASAEAKKKRASSLRADSSAVDGDAASRNVAGEQVEKKRKATAAAVAAEGNAKEKQETEAEANQRRSERETREVAKAKEQAEAELKKSEAEEKSESVTHEAAEAKAKLAKANDAPVSAALQALGSARFIDDINKVNYPDKIMSPKPELNETAEPGKFRYDRDFLLQFMGVYKEKPESMPALSSIGMDPAQIRVGSRNGGSRRASGMGPPAPPGRAGSTGLGLGIGGSAFVKVAGNMGQFSHRETSEERSASENRRVVHKGQRLSPVPCRSENFRAGPTRVFATLGVAESSRVAGSLLATESLLDVQSAVAASTTDATRSGNSSSSSSSSRKPAVTSSTQSKLNPASSGTSGATAASQPQPNGTSAATPSHSRRQSAVSPAKGLAANAQRMGSINFDSVADQNSRSSSSPAAQPSSGAHPKGNQVKTLGEAEAGKTSTSAREKVMGFKTGSADAAAPATTKPPIDFHKLFQKNPAKSSVAATPSIPAPAPAPATGSDQPVPPTATASDTLQSSSPSAQDRQSQQHRPRHQDRSSELLGQLTLANFNDVSMQLLKIISESSPEKKSRRLHRIVLAAFENAKEDASRSNLYARLCRSLMDQLSLDVEDTHANGPDGKPTPGGALLRRYMLNLCQEDFERGWGRYDATAELFTGKEAKKQTVEARRRGPALMRFIGELFKLSMLTERIVHACVRQLIAKCTDSEHAAVECLCVLLETVGQRLDGLATAHIDFYVHCMDKMEGGGSTSSEQKEMLRGVLHLRKSNWQKLHAVASPNTSDATQEDAASQCTCSICVRHLADVHDKSSSQWNTISISRKSERHTSSIHEPISIISPPRKGSAALANLPPQRRSAFIRNAVDLVFSGKLEDAEVVCWLFEAWHDSGSLDDEAIIDALKSLVCSLNDAAVNRADAYNVIDCKASRRVRPLAGEDRSPQQRGRRR